MEINFVEMGKDDFDATLYVKLLVAVAKSDPGNGQPEYEYVKSQANRLGIDIVDYWNSTDKSFLVSPVRASRLTAMVIIKDCILLASMDGNFSPGEKEKVYLLAQNLDVPRSDVDAVQAWLEKYYLLRDEWNRILD